MPTVVMPFLWGCAGSDLGWQAGVVSFAGMVPGRGSAQRGESAPVGAPKRLAASTAVSRAPEDLVVAARPQQEHRAVGRPHRTQIRGLRIVTPPPL